MSEKQESNKYNRSNIDTMEMVYGRGYLSAGGDDEVVKMFDGLDIQGKRVLDLGCGLGGAAVVIVNDLDAGELIAYDIDETVLSRAEDLVEEKGIADKVELVKGRPGLLQFSKDSFDIVYTTATSCHIEELDPFFKEIHRVLKPNGWLVGCEWLKGKENQAYRTWDDLLRERGLNFYFVEKPIFADALSAVGFDDIHLVDRTEAFTTYSKDAVEYVRGELSSQLIESIGDTDYQAFLEWATVRYDALVGGGMQQSHFRAHKI